MTRLTLVAATLAALVLPGLALAKGPSEGSISGPGFSKTVKVLYDGGGGSAGDNLTQQAGFFPAAFGQSPDPMLHRKPAGTLGPRYAIAWKVPGGGGENFRLRQDLYPYAHGGAVTYTKPGQPIFGATTRGGWYRDPALKGTLVSMGLSAKAPSTDSGTNYGSLPARRGRRARRDRALADPASARPEVAVDEPTELPAGSRA
jgi:hypothetical protein